MSYFQRLVRPDVVPFFVVCCFTPSVAQADSAPRVHLANASLNSYPQQHFHHEFLSISKAQRVPWREVVALVRANPAFSDLGFRQIADPEPVAISFCYLPTGEGL